MRAQEIFPASSQMKTYAFKVKLKTPGYTNIFDTTTTARSPQMARMIIAKLYGVGAIVGQPRELK